MKPASPSIIDGIHIYHPDVADNHSDYRSSGLDILYRMENQHCWFIARKELIVAQIKKYFSKSDALMEVGAGTGNIARAILSEGYDIAVGDLHTKGLVYAGSYGIQKRYQFDIYRSPFSNEFDGLLMFDVLEHLERDVDVLKQAHTMLRPGGKLVLTVPALMALWSRVDVLSGHKRRYTLAHLETLAKEAGFSLLYSRYFFHSLVPLLWLSRTLHKNNSPVTKEEAAALVPESVSPLLNYIMLQILRLDNLLGSFVPRFFGASIILVAQKK